MKVSRLGLIGHLLLAFAATAQANEYPVTALTLVMNVDCTNPSAPRASLATTGYEMKAQVQLPATANSSVAQIFDDGFQDITYSVEADDSIVLTKKVTELPEFAALLTPNPSVNIGKPSPESLAAVCNGEAKTWPPSVAITLNPGVTATEQVNWIAPCEVDSNAPDGSGVSFEKPFEQNLVIDAPLGQSITLSIYSKAVLGISEQPTLFPPPSCDATPLP